MLQILKEMAQCYQKKKPSDLVGTIYISIGEENDHKVKLKEDEVFVERGKESVEDLRLTMSEETFEKLRSGEWNGMTATGRSNMSESAPLDFSVPEGKDLDEEKLQMLYHFLTHFFTTEYPTVTDLGREHSRKVHGGSAVPIAYGHGVRHAYYTIKRGEQINEDELDPWKQVFTVISGTGKAIIDGEEIELEKNMSVHVPPNVEHIVKKDEGEGDLELVWVAYGEKA